MKVIIKSCSLLLISCLLFSCSGTKWITGTWEGNGDQIDGKSWKIKLDSDGQSNYEIEYPSLSCSGTWAIISKKKNEIIFQEKIDQNDKGKCDQGAEIHATRIDKNQVKLVFYLRSYDAEKAIATGIVKRK